MATIVTRAGKGSPLTHNEVDANFNNLNSDKVESSALGTAAYTASTDYATAAQGSLADSAVQPNDSPTFAGLTTTANISFGDNDKAIFGAGSDLQIYHDGEHSFISEVGSGNLRIRGETLQLLTPANLKYFQGSGGTGYYYHNDALRMQTTATGVTFTGDVVSDGLTVDTNTLHVDSTNNRVGVGTTSPSAALDVVGDAEINGNVRVPSGGAGTNSGIWFDGSRGMYYDYDLRGSYGLQFLSSPYPMTFVTNGDAMRWSVDNKATDAMWLSTAGNLGIGTTSPAVPLNISRSSNEQIRLQNTAAGGGSGYISFYETGGSRVAWVGNSSASNTNFQINNQSASGYVSINTNNTERMRITSAGSVGIGTTSPSAKLDVNGTAYADNYIEDEVYLGASSTITPHSITASDGGIQRIYMDANLTLYSSLSNGESVMLMINMAGSYTITWPTTTWIGTDGAAPTLAASSGWNVIVFWKANSKNYAAYVGEA